MDPTSQRLLLGSSASGEKYWISRLGSSSGDIAYSKPSIDSQGNVYLSGSTSALGTSDILTAKFDPTGAISWQRVLSGGSGDDLGYMACLDSSSNVYNVGYSLTSTTYRGYIAKYNNLGALQWQYRLGTAASGDYYFGAAIDSSDNIYVIGQTFTPRTSLYDLWVTKFTTSGSVAWNLTIYPSGNYSYGTAIATDSSGNVYAVGQIYSSTFGTNLAFIAKIDSSGSVLWQRQFYLGLSGDFASSVVVDSSNNVYVGGYALSGSYYIGLILKYDSSGTLLWQRSLSSALGNVVLQSIDLDNSANVYVCGYMPTASTSLAFFIAKYDSSGALQWQRMLDGATATADIGSGIKTYGNSVTVTGYSTTSSVGGNDILIMKVPSDGSLTGTYGPYTYSASSLTAGTPSTGQLTTSYLTALPSIAPTTASLTDSAGTLTNSVINIP